VRVSIRGHLDPGRDRSRENIETMDTSRFARTVALASFLGTASLVGGAAFETLGPAEAEAYYEVDQSYFYTSLAAHGSWVSSAEFGWVWYPTHRPLGWRPYTVGHWSYADGGDWLWVSAEPHGWATHHYGRWYLDPFYGWVWIPGRVWAPAWVSWRDCDDYLGWAPLGPWGYWDSHYHGYRGWNRYDRWYDDDHHHGHHDGHHGDHDGDWDRDDWDRGDRDRMRVRGDDRDNWNFARKRDFAGTRIDKVRVRDDQAAGLFNRSRPLPPPSVEDERAGRGITRATNALDRQSIERASGRSIRPVKLEEDKAPPMRGGSQVASGKGGSDRVRVFRPSVKDKPGAKTPDQLGLAKAPNRGGRGEDARDPRSTVRGSDNRGGQSKADRSIDTGARERPARADERGGYERPARADERGGFERPTATKNPQNERQPASEVRGGNRGGSDRATQAERRDLDSQPRGHPVHRFDQSLRQKPAAESPRRSSYDAPTVDQRRTEKPRVDNAPASRGGGYQPRSASPTVERNSSPPRQSYSGSGRGDSPTRPYYKPQTRQSYGGGSAPRQSYGNERGGSAPRPSYNAPSRQSYGGGSAPRQSYGGGSAPRQSYSGSGRSSSPARQSYSGGGSSRGSSGGGGGYSGGGSRGGGGSSYSGGGSSRGGSNRHGKGSSGYSGGGGGGRGTSR
jgi:hypothetical protein